MSHSSENIPLPSVTQDSYLLQAARLLDIQAAQRKLLAERDIINNAFGALSPAKQARLEALQPRPIVYCLPSTDYSTDCRTYEIGINFVAPKFEDGQVENVAVRSPVGYVEQGLVFPHSTPYYDFTEDEATLVYGLHCWLMYKRATTLPDLSPSGESIYPCSNDASIPRSDEFAPPGPG